MASIVLKVLQTVSFCVLVLCHTRRAAAVQLLAFGDSVDRMMSVELCGVLSVIPGVDVELQEGWGGKSLRYEYSPTGRIASAICTARYADTMQSSGFRSDSIAFVQFYGSRPHGPYQVSNKTDPLVDTEPRMQFAYAAYAALFGHPDILQLHFATWEVAQLRRHEAGSEADLLPGAAFHAQSVTAFESNMRARVTQAQALVASSNRTGGTRVSLRTGLWTVTEQHLMPPFNAVLRRLSAELRVDLHDLDRDVWSAADWARAEEPRMFRDPMHPITPYCVHGALKAMRLQYSRYYNAYDRRPAPVHVHDAAVLVGPPLQARHAHAGHAHTAHTHKAGRGQRQQVWLVAGAGVPMNSSADIAQGAFMYNYHAHTRHRGLTPEVLTVLRLGVGDVMEVSESWLAGAPIGAEFAGETLKTCNVIGAVMSNLTAPPLPLHLAAGPIFSNLRGSLGPNTAPATQHIYWGRLQSKILVRIPHEDAARALSHFFAQEAPCLSFPQESAALLPLGIYSPSHVMYNAPYGTNNTEGMLVRVDGQANVYQLREGRRKYVTQDDIAAMPSSQDKVVRLVDSYQGISIFPEKV